MYVQRNQKGDIIGAFTNPQAGYAEEYLAPDNAELQGFLQAARNRLEGN